MSRSFAAAAVIVLLLSSCSKFEDGPKFSLRTKKARLTNDWVMDKVFINDVDKTSDYAAFYNGFVLSIKKDETYTTTSPNGNTSGTWELGEDKDDIRFQQTTPAGNGEVSYRILRLTNKEFWGRLQLSNGDTQKIYYKQK